MKLVSWNVNGLRACLQKGFYDSVAMLDADILCLQETKMEQGQAVIDLPEYTEFWNSAQKKGYSGTAIFTKEKPLQVAYGMDKSHHDNEGRLITLEYSRFYLVNVYTPNAQRGLARLDYRMQWEDDFREYLVSLAGTKPVIVCGDMNVAHQPIDLKNPSANRKNAGFSDEERAKMSELLESGFVDSFRYLYPDKKDAYSWWSYMGGARDRNVGWRIDYFLTSTALVPLINDAEIFPDVMGSDHCPVGLKIDL